MYNTILQSQLPCEAYGHSILKECCMADFSHSLSLTINKPSWASRTKQSPFVAVERLSALTILTLSSKNFH